MEMEISVVCSLCCPATLITQYAKVAEMKIGNGEGKENTRERSKNVGMEHQDSHTTTEFTDLYQAGEWV